MLGNPFSRRRTAGGRTRFTFDNDPLENDDSQDAIAPIEIDEADKRPSARSGLAPVADEVSAATPETRRRDAETLAGGADRLAEIEDFTVSNYLPETEQKRLRGEKAGRNVWTPQKPGVIYRAVPNAPPPDPVSARRRLQLRDVARRFSAHQFWNPNNQRFELRLLPRPVANVPRPILAAQSRIGI